MDLLRYPGPCRAPAGGCVVTIGAYDGIHIGHQALIRRVRAQAAELGIASAVVTFDQHPAMVVRPESAPRLLCDQEQKLELLAATGVDVTLIVRFDRDRAEESSEEFVHEVLVGCLAARAVVVGHDFHFGYKRRGDVPMLQRMGAELDFDVTGVHLYPDHPGGEPVSSTRIRQLLEAGDVAAAALLLGRPHQVRGIVARGDERGRELGFPTANVTVPAAIALPADGVYAGWYQRPDGVRRPAALSVGSRPTFYDDHQRSVLEAYLLDFDGELYDEPARVEFVEHLRPQERFEGVEGLV
ncbi:MAG: bifunctional riboflavin kinase/FAD synthetase, partial [Acidimicrobiaceae bacterium]|nr:bifunctional riboflavin kinase/FAD synthetase [Acidimicrobiaceae bacterium]